MYRSKRWLEWGEDWCCCGAEFETRIHGVWFMMLAFIVEYPLVGGGLASVYCLGGYVRNAEGTVIVVSQHMIISSFHWKAGQCGGFHQAKIFHGWEQGWEESLVSLVSTGPWRETFVWRSAKWHSQFYPFPPCLLLRLCRIHPGSSQGVGVK